MAGEETYYDQNLRRTVTRKTATGEDVATAQSAEKLQDVSAISRKIAGAGNTSAPTAPARLPNEGLGEFAKRTKKWREDQDQAMAKGQQKAIKGQE